MEVNGEYQIEAAREVVWAALNDDDILRQALPGCESLERISDTDLDARVKLKVGPVAVNLTARIQLKDLDPPNGYTISGDGKGGPAGFAKGEARVSLEDVGGATLLRYDVDARLGGKLGQLGSRMIDATAKKIAGEFFRNFSELVAPAKTEEGDEVEPARASWLAQPAWWVGGFVTLLALVVLVAMLSG